MRILLLTLFLVSCGGSGSNSKDLFSLWTEVTTGAKLDLNGFSLGRTDPLSLFFGNGDECSCNLTFIGTQSSGNYTLNSCYYIYGSGNSDPGCNALNISGSYTKTADLLTTLRSDGITVNYR